LSYPTKIFGGELMSGCFRVGEAVKVERLPISYARLEKMDVRANMRQNFSIRRLTVGVMTG
jgi:hypothetical protein